MSVMSGVVSAPLENLFSINDSDSSRVIETNALPFSSFKPVIRDPIWDRNYGSMLQNWTQLSIPMTIP